MQLMYISPQAYVIIHFISILSPQYVECVLTLKVHFQFGCWIVQVYCVGERWHVLPCGTKKMCCIINMNCSFGSYCYVHWLIVSCSYPVHKSTLVIQNLM